MSKTQSRLGVTIPTTCPCCERVWLWVNGLGTAELYWEGFDQVVENLNIVWQYLTGVNTWTDAQTGGTTLISGAPTDGDLIRVEFTDIKGCVHYSNVAVLTGI